MMRSMHTLLGWTQMIHNPRQPEAVFGGTQPSCRPFQPRKPPFLTRIIIVPDEALTPSTQDDDCMCCLLYAKSQEFDPDITTTHLIMKEELKLAKEANETLQCELNKKNNEAAINKKKYNRPERQHTSFREDVNEWIVQAQKRVCVLCNLAQPVSPVPVIGDIPDGTSSSHAVSTVATARKSLQSLHQGMCRRKGASKPVQQWNIFWPTIIYIFNTVIVFSDWD